MNVLVGFLVACAVMAAAVWALNRRALGRLPTLSQFECYLDLTPDRYRHLPRLFGPEDFSFLEGARSGRALLPRLRKERRRVMRLLLADLRDDFEALLAVGFLLSVTSAAKDDGYAALLGRQSLRFYTLYLGLNLCSFWSGAWPWRFDTAPLWKQVKALRHSTQTLMRALTPNDVDQLRQSLGVELEA